MDIRVAASYVFKLISVALF